MALDSEKSTENVEPKSENDTTVTETTETSSEQSIEDVMAELEHQRAINKEVIASRDSAKNKLREIQEMEESYKSKLQESETLVAELNEKYSAVTEKTTELESKLKDVTLTSTLKEALNEAGVASVNTAMKLIEKDAVKFDESGSVDQGSIAEAITMLKEEHAILFNAAVGGAGVKGPKPVRPSEESSSGGYAEELRKLQQNPKATRQDFDSIKKKYGRA